MLFVSYPNLIAIVPPDITSFSGVSRGGALGAEAPRTRGHQKKKEEEKKKERKGKKEKEKEKERKPMITKNI